MSGSNIGLLAVGIVFVGVGVVFIRFRRQIAVLMANGQRDFFGEVGRRVAPSSTPALSAWVGAGFIALGVISVFCALFLKVSS